MAGCSFQEIFGNDLVITKDGVTIGTKGVLDYSRNVSDDELARDPNLDVDSRKCNGKEINIEPYTIL